MSPRSFVLPTAFDRRLAEELLAYLPYCVEGVRRFSIADKPLRLEFSCGEGDAEPVESSLRRMLAVLEAPLGAPAYEARILFDGREPGRRARGPAIFPRLLDEGQLVECGPGLYAMGKLFLRVFKFFERACYRLALEFQPEEYVYPTLIPVGQLPSGGGAGYHTTYVSAQSGGDGRNPIPGHACKWAICLHCYPQFQGRVLERNLTITSQGRCFRHEERGNSTMDRLWEFIMREIVFLGDGDYVRAGLRKAETLAGELTRRLELDAWIESAADPFYASAEDPPFYRLIPDAKHELRLELAEGEQTISTASFNFHGPYFARRYGIASAGGECAATGCAGFGIERFTYAFLSRHGLDPEKWPASIRGEVLA